MGRKPGEKSCRRKILAATSRHRDRVPLRDARPARQEAATSSTKTLSALDEGRGPPENDLTNKVWCSSIIQNLDSYEFLVWEWTHRTAAGVLSPPGQQYSEKQQSKAQDKDLKSASGNDVDELPACAWVAHRRGSWPDQTMPG